LRRQAGRGFLARVVGLVGAWGRPSQAPTIAASIRRMAPDIVGSTIAGVISGVFGLCCALVLLRWCRRRRFYKKVQRAMDAEELAFQKSLAKNYSEEMAELDDTER